MKALKDKRVLVIQPFDSIIKKQYQKHNLIFKNNNYLLEFELFIVKAVQTIADNEDSRFADWFEALDYVYNEAMKPNFDIALIGYRAYGFPLAYSRKKVGKQVIHLGGKFCKFIWHKR